MKEETKKTTQKQRLKDLQMYQIGQMTKQKELKEKEIVNRKEKTETSFYPRTDREGGVDAELKGKISNPFTVPVGRKFLGIPNVPKKGLGYRVSESELLSSLTHQIETKSRMKREEKEMKLEEEKRYVDHIAMELDYDSQTKQLEAAQKKAEMMQAWERESFLKKMKILRMKGDIDGLRKEHEALKLTAGHSVPTLPKISNNQFDSARDKEGSKEGFGDAGVGFDSRHVEGELLSGKYLV